jgi:hypothetical protein
MKPKKPRASVQAGYDHARERLEDWLQRRPQT